MHNILLAEPDPLLQKEAERKISRMEEPTREAMRALIRESSFSAAYCQYVLADDWEEYRRGIYHNREFWRQIEGLDEQLYRHGVADEGCRIQVHYFDAQRHNARIEQLVREQEEMLQDLYTRTSHFIGYAREILQQHGRYTDSADHLHLSATDEEPEQSSYRGRLEVIKKGYHSLERETLRL